MALLDKGTVQHADESGHRLDKGAVEFAGGIIAFGAWQGGDIVELKSWYLDKGSVQHADFFGDRLDKGSIEFSVSYA
jgi:hypothetical protein